MTTRLTYYESTQRINERKEAAIYVLWSNTTRLRYLREQFAEQVEINLWHYLLELEFRKG